MSGRGKNGFRFGNLTKLLGKDSPLRREGDTLLRSFSFLFASANARKQQHTWPPARYVGLDSPRLSLSSDRLLSLPSLRSSQPFASFPLFSLTSHQQLLFLPAAPLCTGTQRPLSIWIFFHRILNSILLTASPLLTLSLSLSQQQLSTHHSPALSCSVCPKVTVFPACGCPPLWQKLRLKLSPPKAKLAQADEVCDGRETCSS
jgi:hypothetical protein